MLPTLVSTDAVALATLDGSNPFLARVKPFPAERTARYNALFSNGRLGDRLEDVRKLKDENEFFVPSECHLSAGHSIVDAVCDSYLHRNPTNPQLAGFLGRQAQVLRTHRIQAFPRAAISGQCIIVAGPPGIGKGVFRRRIRAYIGTDVIPHGSIPPAIQYVRQLPYVEMQFPGNMKVDTLSNLLLMQIDSQVHGVAFNDSQGQSSRGSLLRPRLYAQAGAVGLGLLYLYGLDAHRLSLRSAMECLNFLQEFAEYTGVPVVCSSTYAIWGLMNGASVSALQLGSRAVHRFDYVPLESDWRALVNAFLKRYRLSISTEEVEVSSRKLIPPRLLRDSGAGLMRPTWFEVELMAETLGVPKQLFNFLAELWVVLNKKKENKAIVETTDFIKASVQYRKATGGLRANLSILLSKDKCSDEETARFSDWLLPEQRAAQW
ncbi:hypothetical protein ACQUJV_24610 [Ralstonia pseudosolanacearum]